MLSIDKINEGYQLSDELEVRIYQTDVADKVLIDQKHFIFGYILQGCNFMVSTNHSIAGFPIDLNHYEKMVADITYGINQNLGSPEFHGVGLFGSLFRNLPDIAFRSPKMYELETQGRPVGVKIMTGGIDSDYVITEGPYAGRNGRSYFVQVWDIFYGDLAPVTFSLQARAWAIPNVGKPITWVQNIEIVGGMGYVTKIHTALNPDMVNWEGEGFEFINPPKTLRSGIATPWEADTKTTVEAIVCLVRK